MSLGYRVTWATQSCRVEGGDTLRVDVGMLGILAEPEMTSLLRDELARDGWRRDDDGGMSRDEGDVTERLSPDGRSVTATVRAVREVTGRGVNADAAKAAAAQQADRERERLQSDAAKQLAGHEGSLRGRLGAAVQRVYVEALKRKATSMGEVESVHERQDENGEHEVVIRVRV